MRIHTRRLPRIRLRQRQRSFSAVFSILLLLGMFLALVLLIDRQLRPAVQEFAYTRAVALATTTVHDAVCEALEQSNVGYPDLVHLMTDEHGAVTALTTNSVEINRLRAHVIAGVVRKLDQLKNTQLYIPFGAVTGIDLFAGVGPMIRISVVPLGTAQAKFCGEFSSSGINQTIHRIYLELDAMVTILLPGQNIPAQISAQFDVAQTVIVGAVPDSYTRVEDATGGKITDEIFNFADPG